MKYIILISIVIISCSSNSQTHVDIAGLERDVNNGGYVLFPEIGPFENRIRQTRHECVSMNY